MHILLELTEEQNARLTELTAKLRKLYSEQYRAFREGMSRRAYAGESITALNQESMEMSKRSSTFSRSNILRVLIDTWTKDDTSLEDLLKTFVDSDSVRYLGRHSHKDRVQQIEDASPPHFKRKPVINLSKSQGSLTDGEE